MGTLIERLRRVRREALGLNRRNQEFMIRLNPAPLVGLVDHKIRTKDVLAQHRIQVPTTYGSYRRQSDLARLSKDLDAHPSCVLKPARGAGGEGILVLCERQGQDLLMPGGARVSLRQVLAQAADIIAGAYSLSQSRDDALLEQRLLPDAVLGGFSPAGIPDVRVVVVRGVPIMAMVRLPTRASDGRANLHMGGVGVGIGLASGRAVHAIWRDQPIAVHPDTQQPLSALRIPCWDEILLLAARAYEAVPLGYFGIDIVIDSQLGPAVLELNARPGLSIQLATHRGLRPRLRALEEQWVAGLPAAERVRLGIDVEKATASP
jgi:alpha-L-glutamate ligase-like protein